MRFLSSVSFRVQTVETKFDDREISTIKYKVFFSYTVLPPHPSGRKTYIKKRKKENHLGRTRARGRYSKRFN